MNLLITGGCGYVGTPLTQSLLALGHHVTVVDAQWFGNPLAAHPHLTLICADLRQLNGLPLHDYDAIINLAQVTSEGSAARQPDRMWETNVEATSLLVERAINAGVPHFIHASSDQIYGSTASYAATELSPLLGESRLARAQMFAERFLLSYAKEIKVHVVRSGFAAGFSPRMRLDLPANLFALQALTRGRITVTAADQAGTHLHVRDLVGVFEHLLVEPIAEPGVYNAGFESLTQLELAQRVAAQIPAEIEVSLATTGEADSIRVDSSHLLATGFHPQYGLDDAIWEIAAEYRMGRLRDEERFYNFRPSAKIAPAPVPALHRAA